MVVQPGNILLFHDGFGEPYQTIEAVFRLVQKRGRRRVWSCFGERITAHEQL